ncbi:MAG: sugar transferase [Pirellulaceae bacterium]|nr:sugar transferase [Planctomycetales bacterium]
MVFKTVLRGLGLGAGATSELPAGMLSVEEFEKLLLRERLRTDRTHRSFSVVLMDVISDRCQGLVQIAAVGRRRLRLTDDVGMMPGGRPALLLPETDEKGAWKVANDMRDLLRDRVDFTCDVYVYPTPEDRSQFDSGQFDERSGDDTSDEFSNDGAMADDELDNVGIASAESTSPGRTLAGETLFVRGLPAWKRAIDILGAGLGLMLLSPVMVASAAAIKATSHGPVFFTQPRDGIGGRQFTIVKFRTMVEDAEELKQSLMDQNEQDGPAFKIRRDPRITTVGRYLRKTCIDELPQLWNVLRGDMSLVGPRPMCSKEARMCRGWERRRLDVTPGVTCIWQVEGKNQVPFADWMRMDIRYITARGFVKDMTLILRTILAVVLHRGSH